MRNGLAFTTAMVLFTSARLMAQTPVGTASPPSLTPPSSPPASLSLPSSSSNANGVPVPAALPPGASTNAYGVPIQPERPYALSDDESLPPNRVPKLLWFRADYLTWFVRKQNTGPLIQTIPDGQSQSSSTLAGSATTLFPDNNSVKYGSFSGVRLNAGFWFDGTQRVGFDTSGFVLANNSIGASFASNGSPILARFYNNANGGALTSLQFSNPDPATGYSGSLSAESKVTSLYGADASIRWEGYSLISDRTDYLAGFRYFDFRERLDINGNALLRSGTQLNVQDHFAVSNQFYGAQAGLHARWCSWSGFSVDGIFKLALGDMHQQADISGSNTLTPSGGPPSTQNTGLFAQASNSGTHSRNKFAAIPELTMNLNYNVTQYAAVFVGYNYTYISSVLRTGGAIDSNVNDANIRYIANPTPGTNPGPLPTIRGESMWLQGVNVGLRLEY